jgi:hypothetical protein
MSNLPWEPNFIPAAVDQALVNAATTVEQDVAAAATTIGSTVATAVTGAAPGAGGATPATPPAPPTGGSITDAITQAASTAAEDALKAVLPSVTASIESRVAASVESEITSVVKNLSGGSQATISAPDLSDFTKADAWTHAVRTLLIGMGLSAAWGLINILTQATNLGETLGWENPQFWTQVASIAVSSVVGSVTAYVARIVKEPAAVTALATSASGSSG